MAFKWGLCKVLSKQPSVEWLKEAPLKDVNDSLSVCVMHVNCEMTPMY